MTKKVNDLAGRARTNQLKPDEIQDGTYTVTNVGALVLLWEHQSSISHKLRSWLWELLEKSQVIETPEGDFIGIRQKMFVSHSTTTEW